MSYHLPIIHTLQHNTSRCNMLQHTRMKRSFTTSVSDHLAILHTLQHTATPCNTLQHTCARRSPNASIYHHLISYINCSTLHYTATNLNPKQQTNEAVAEHFNSLRPSYHTHTVISAVLFSLSASPHTNPDTNRCFKISRKKKA